MNMLPCLSNGAIGRDDVSDHREHLKAMTALVLLDDLERYEFQGEGGSLVHAVVWTELKERIAQLETFRTAVSTILALSGPDDGAVEIEQIKWLLARVAQLESALAVAHRACEGMVGFPGDLSEKIRSLRENVTYQANIRLTVERELATEREQRKQVEAERDGHRRGAGKLAEAAANNLIRAERAEERIATLTAEIEHLQVQLAGTSVRFLSNGVE